MAKNVIFSNSDELLNKERNAAFRAGVAMQLRDLRVVTKDFKPDWQFRNGLAIVVLSEDASDSIKEKAELVKAAYKDLNVRFFSSVGEMLKVMSEAEESTTENPDAVAGVDTPDPNNGIGTIEDLKPSRKKK